MYAVAFDLVVADNKKHQAIGIQTAARLQTQPNPDCQIKKAIPKVQPST